MRRFLFNMKLALKATARSSRPARKALAKDNPFRSAITPAKVLDLIVAIIVNAMQNLNPFKPFPRQVYLLHDVHYISPLSPSQGSYV